MVLIILSNIFKMLQYSLLNIHFHKAGSQSPGKLTGIGIGPVCGAEAGHGYCTNLASVHSQKVKGSGRYQKGQGRIQTSGNTQNRTFAACMLQTFFQSHSLNHQNFVTSFFSLIYISRHERIGVYISGKRGFLHRQAEGNFLVTFLTFLLPGGDSSSLSLKALKVQNRLNGFILEHFRLS